MNTKVAKDFREFVRKHKINGRIAAEIMGINTAYFYQKICGAGKIMDDDRDKLKKGYKKYLREKIKELNEDL